jgi:hypothetical protein
MILTIQRVDFTTFDVDREASQHLDQWLVGDRRRPLILRGARQVGKTWLARDLAARHGLDLVECNFERDPALARAFRGSDPQRILGELGIALGRRVEVPTSLLFLDEIQAVQEVLPSLRWFAEDLPQLPVIAAGSLLDFMIEGSKAGMPVGRVGYLHIHPLSFPEFVRAHGQGELLTRLRAWRSPQALGDVALDAAQRWYERYSMVGGMPAAVQADIDGAEAHEVRALQTDLLATFLGDFGRYAGRTDPGLLGATLRSVAHQMGTKFVYATVAPGGRSDAARRALELLANARVCHIVSHTSANGVPLGGQIRPRNRKAILLDVGLAHAMLRTPATQVFPAKRDVAPVIRGGLAEQMLGQQLLTLAPPWSRPALYYWQRGGGRPGEIDYLLELDARVVPVESKAGAAGTLKSLHQFMYDKGLDLAVRCDANPPSVHPISVHTTQGDEVAYTLVGLPPSMVWRLPAVVHAARDGAQG